MLGCLCHVMCVLSAIDAEDTMPMQDIAGKTAAHAAAAAHLGLLDVGGVTDGKHVGMAHHLQLVVHLHSSNLFSNESSFTPGSHASHGLTAQTPGNRTSAALSVAHQARQFKALSSRSRSTCGASDCKFLTAPGQASLHFDGAPCVQDAQRLQEGGVGASAKCIIDYVRVQAAAVGQVPAAVGPLRRLLPIDNLSSGSPPLKL